jgi:hypothetical protein
MSFDPHARRFDLRRLYPGIEAQRAEASEAPDAPPVSWDEPSTDDPIRRIIAEVLEQIASERCCVCPRCGAIPRSDGSVLS